MTRSPCPTSKSARASSRSPARSLSTPRGGSYTPYDERGPVDPGLSLSFWLLIGYEAEQLAYTQYLLPFLPKVVLANSYVVGPVRAGTSTDHVPPHVMPNTRPSFPSASVTKKLRTVFVGSAVALTTFPETVQLPAPAACRVRVPPDASGRATARQTAAAQSSAIVLRPIHIPPCGSKWHAVHRPRPLAG